MNQHFSKCAEFQHIVNIFRMPDMCNDADQDSASRSRRGERGPRIQSEDHTNDDFYLESLRTNTDILATASDWLTLAYLEPLMAKRHGSSINGGEKAMRSLNLF